MGEIRIAEVALPAAWDEETETGRIFRDWVEVDDLVWFNEWGNNKTSTPANERWVSHAKSTSYDRIRLAAFSEDKVIGFAQADLPLLENTHTADLEISVLPEYRNKGVGTKLADALESMLLDRDRTTAITWAEHREYPGPRLIPVSGAGDIPANEPAAKFLVKRGYELEMMEHVTQLNVPDLPADLEDRVEQLSAAAPDYEILTWRSPTPPDLLEPMAHLLAVMSVDVPSAGLEYNAQNWTAARIQEMDTKFLEAGNDALWAAIRHRPSGTLVAYTQMTVSQRADRFVYQGDTLVTGEHRGHRLGLLVKLANVIALRQVKPDGQILTWNADENSHMRAINEELGFRHILVEGAWQKRLEPSEATTD